MQIKVLVRSIDDVRGIINAIPDTWKNDKNMKSEVMFLWDEMDDESVLMNLAIKPILIR